jgi:hypothetical protein
MRDPTLDNYARMLTPPPGRTCWTRFLESPSDLLTELEQLLDLIEARLGQRRVIEHRATDGADKAEAFGERLEVD